MLLFPDGYVQNHKSDQADVLVGCGMQLVEQEEIDLVLAYRASAKNYQTAILVLAKHQAAINKTSSGPVLRLVSSSPIHFGGGSSSNQSFGVS